ncbi:MAG: cell division protein ZapE [Pseudomonas marincola]|uniref:cell division protein ZapE n=1 Tax=Pseudomonas marincola TaxID=437900 RepID=UPI0030031EAC
MAKRLIALISAFRVKAKRCSLTSDSTAPDLLVRQHFAALLGARGYHADPAQQAAIDHLGQWLCAFMEGRQRWLRRPSAGVYLWGGVGRGKSFVLDAVFNAAPLAEKRRVHFHAFLQELQLRMRAFAGQRDPLARVAEQIASETRLLCFDEFHVHDIGDAMLLGRMLKALVDAGVGLICTSNYPPAKLCPNPLYRDRFQPAIDLLNKRFDVLELGGATDYRQASDYCWGRLYWPLEEGSERLGDALGFTAQALGVHWVEINHRPMQLRNREGQRVWVDFTELCRSPRSSADFLWLCEHFRQVALGGVSTLENEGIDVQQRFLNFIDIAYDSGIELLLGCSAGLDQLCNVASHVDFNRTRSRLMQLQPCPVVETVDSAAPQAVLQSHG